MDDDKPQRPKVSKGIGYETTEVERIKEKYKDHYVATFKRKTPWLGICAILCAIIAMIAGGIWALTWYFG